jgi:hypothetical protein
MSVNRLQELTKKVTKKLLAILETTITVTKLVNIFIKKHFANFKFITSTNCTLTSSRRASEYFCRVISPRKFYNSIRTIVEDHKTDHLMANML